MVYCKKTGEEIALKEIYLAGGCFWGCQKAFDRIAGVVSTEVGYANGRVENPTYEQVKQGDSGHAETVRVTYDPARLSLESLLARYFELIDPTSVDRQGEDRGHQYRTGIYFTDPEDARVARYALEGLERRLKKGIAVELQPPSCFYPAEEYHQKYLEKHPDGYCHIRFD